MDTSVPCVGGGGLLKRSKGENIVNNSVPLGGEKANGGEQNNLLDYSALVRTTIRISNENKASLGHIHYRSVAESDNELHFTSTCHDLHLAMDPIIHQNTYAWFHRPWEQAVTIAHCQPTIRKQQNKLSCLGGGTWVTSICRSDNSLAVKCPIPPPPHFADRHFEKCTSLELCGNFNETFAEPLDLSTKPRMHSALPTVNRSRNMFIYESVDDQVVESKPINEISPSNQMNDNEARMRNSKMQSEAVDLSVKSFDAAAPIATHSTTEPIVLDFCEKGRDLTKTSCSYLGNNNLTFTIDFSDKETMSSTSSLTQFVMAIDKIAESQTPTRYEQQKQQMVTSFEFTSDIDFDDIHLGVSCLSKENNMESIEGSSLSFSSTIMKDGMGQHHNEGKNTQNGIELQTSKNVNDIFKPDFSSVQSFTLEDFNDCKENLPNCIRILKQEVVPISTSSLNQSVMAIDKIGESQTPNNCELQKPQMVTSFEFTSDIDFDDTHLVVSGLSKKNNMKSTEWPSLSFSLSKMNDGMGQHHDDRKTTQNEVDLQTSKNVNDIFKPDFTSVQSFTREDFNDCKENLPNCTRIHKQELVPFTISGESSDSEANSCLDFSILQDSDVNTQRSLPYNANVSGAADISQSNPSLGAPAYNTDGSQTTDASPSSPWSIQEAVNSYMASWKTKFCKILNNSPEISCDLDAANTTSLVTPHNCSHQGTPSVESREVEGSSMTEEQTVVGHLSSCTLNSSCLSYPSTPDTPAPVRHQGLPRVIVRRKIYFSVPDRKSSTPRYVNFAKQYVNFAKRRHFASPAIKGHRGVRHRLMLRQKRTENSNAITDSILNIGFLVHKNNELSCENAIALMEKEPRFLQRIQQWINSRDNDVNPDPIICKANKSKKSIIQKIKGRFLCGSGNASLMVSSSNVAGSAGRGCHLTSNKLVLDSSKLTRQVLTQHQNVTNSKIDGSEGSKDISCRLSHSESSTKSHNVAVSNRLRENQLPVSLEVTKHEKTSRAGMANLQDRRSPAMSLLEDMQYKYVPLTKYSSRHETLSNGKATDRDVPLAKLLPYYKHATGKMSMLQGREETKRASLVQTYSTTKRIRSDPCSMDHAFDKVNNEKRKTSTKHHGFRVSDRSHQRAATGPGEDAAPKLPMNTKSKMLLLQRAKAGRAQGLYPNRETCGRL